MRKMSFVLGMLFLFITNANAQGLFGQWKVSKLGVSAGFEQDMIRGLDYSYFASQIPADREWALRDTEFDDSYYHDSVCENPEVALSLTLTNPRFKKWEWRNDIRYKYNRVDNVSYFEDYQPDNGGYWLRPIGNYVDFDGRHRELAFETSIGRAITIVNGLNITPSLGSNFGYTRNNSVCVREVVDIEKTELGERVDGLIDIPESYVPLYECFDTGPIFNHRLFLEVKGSLVVKKRAELYMSIRKGFGYRAGNGHVVGTQGNMVNFGFNWILKKKELEKS